LIVEPLPLREMNAQAGAHVGSDAMPLWEDVLKVDVADEIAEFDAPDIDHAVPDGSMTMLSIACSNLVRDS
jgi:hypothetical protein